MQSKEWWQSEAMRAEIIEAGKRCGLPVESVGLYCQSQRDGDCEWASCPQIKDGEPSKTGRHCPLDLHDDARGYH